MFIKGRLFVFQFMLVLNFLPPSYSICSCGYGSYCGKIKGDCLCREISNGLYATPEDPNAGCNELIDYCTSSPCQNGGTCFPSFGSYYCTCPEGYHGQSCDLSTDPAGGKTYAQNVAVYYDIHEAELLNGITVLVILKEKGDDLKIEVDDGDGQLQYTPFVSLNQTNPLIMCLEIVNSMREGLNPEVCNWVTNEISHVFKVLLKYSIENKPDRTIMSNDVPVGRKDIMTVTVKNGDELQYSQTFPVFTSTNLDKRQCILDVRLKGGSVDMRNPVVYYRNQAITIKSTTTPLHTRCKLVTAINYVWVTTGYSSGTVFNQRSKAATFKEYDAKRLLPGVYTVELTVDVIGSPDPGKKKTRHRNVRKCYFELKYKQVIAKIKYGKRRVVQQKTKVVLDASLSKDPNYDNNNRLRYEWSCNQEQSFCKSVTLKDPVRTISSMPLGTYEFFLNVTHKVKDIPSDATSQIIEVIAEPVIEDFEISCLSNCENTRVYELGQLQLKGLPKGKTATWTYTKDDGPEKSVDDIRQEGTPDEVFILKENVLERGSTYRIKARVDKTYTETELTTVKPPSTGSCEVNPTSGERGVTLFEISCSDFESNVPEGEPLHYDIYQKVVSKQFSGKFENFLISSANVPMVSNLQLVNEEIVIKVSNLFGESVTSTVAVQLTEPEFSKKIVGDFVIKAQENVRHGEIEKAVSSIYVVSDHIEEMSPKSTVINNLIDTLSKIPLLKVSDAEQVAEGLHYLLFQSISFDNQILSAASVRTSTAILKNITSNIKDLFKKSNFVDTEDVKGLIRSLAGCVNALIKSRNKYLLDKSMNIEQYGYSYFRYIRSTFDLLKAIDGYSELMFSYMIPCQKPVMIEEELIVTNLMVDRMDRLALLPSIDPLQNQSAYIKFDPQLSRSYKGKDIDVQVTHFKENWFWWVETEIPMNSDHLNVVLRVHNGSKISNLKYPLHIFMKTTGVDAKPIQGEVTQPDPFLSEEVKDLFVKVFRLERVEGKAGKMFLRCPDLGDVVLDVLIVVDEYPDYDKVRSQGKTLSSSDSSYESRSLDGVSPEAMIYLGILPNKKHSIGDHVEFTCQLHDQFCRTWSKENWDIKYCEIGNGSTNDLIHCSCTHLSMFGVSLLVPPNELHPLQDIILFISIKDNPYVLAFVLLFLSIYFALFIWAWRMDLKDKNERVVRVLVDNFPGEKFGYLLAVFTGEKTMSGTTAHVGVKICGSRSASHAHILNHEKDVLQLAQDNWFLIFTEKYLGEIECLRVWHDNFGASPDWYCNKIVLYDLKTKDKYTFLVEKWLSVYNVESNWRLEWVLVPVRMQDNEWQNLARENFFTNLRESHLWISIFVRHPRTAYTRLQRLTVAMCIIMVTMLLAIMFYGAAQKAAVDEPKYSLSTRELIVTLECLVISFPVSFLVATLFKWSRPKPEKRMDDSEIHKGKPMGEMVSDFVKGFLLLDPLMPVELSDEAPEPKERSMARRIFLILAWIVSFTIIIGCSTFLVLYGLKLGPNKSLTWVSITLLRLGQSIFIIQPAKIILYALLFTFLFKEYNRNVMLFSIEYKGIDPALKEDNSYMTKLMELRSKPMYNPLSQMEVMMLAKKRKRVEQQKWRIINFISVFILFFALWVLTSGSDNSIAYYNTEHLSYLIRSPASITDLDIDEVYNQSRFYEYAIKTLLPSIHTTQWYNGEDLPTENEESDLPKTKVRGWTNDFSSKVIGVPRLRQLRITKETCYVPEEFQSEFDSCNSSFSTYVEDRHPYTTNWVPASFDGTEEQWYYSSPEDSETLGMYGASGYYYPGGGYIKNLTTNMQDSSEELIRLKIEDWFDELTRVIFIEFNLYNAFSNLFSQVTIIIENLASGVIGTRVYIDTAYHQFYMEALDVPFLIALIFFIVVLILSLMRVVVHVSVQGMGPFISSHGNVIDILIIFFGFSCVIAYLVRVSYFKMYSHAFERTVNEEYVSFTYPFYQDDLGSLLFSILIILTAIRLLQLAYYGKYYYILRDTIYHSKYYIFGSLALVIFLTSLISLGAYIADMQNYRMFYILIVPKINFLNHREFSDRNILFKVELNLIYLIGGMFIAAVTIVFYGKSKFHFLTLGRVETYTNNFRFLYHSFRQGIEKILADDMELRIQQGTATRKQKNKYRRKLYDAAKERVAKDYKLKKWEADDIMADFVTASLRHKRMCAQIDQLMELID